LINNRQGGRRRGRGGQRGSNQGQPGNRQDNRQRGNAAQLLEKYKSMARDAQLSGDRVQTEYYLQFADHYFRVLSETRARFEDQRPRRDDDGDEDDGDEEMADAEAADAADERPARRERPRRNDGEERPRRRAERSDDDGDEDREERPERAERPQRRPRANGSGDTLSLNVLPPAIGRGDEEGDAEESAPKRTRARRAKADSDDGDEVAPAA
jgi:hypothetical protein